MYHQDFLIRTLQQFIVVLARIAGLKKADDPEVLLIEIESASRMLLGLDLRLLGSLTAESLLPLLSYDGKPDPARIVTAARILAEKGTAEAALGNPDQAAAAKEKAEKLLKTLVIEESDSGELYRVYKETLSMLQDRCTL